MIIRFAKLNFLSPSKGSLARLDISAPESIAFSPLSVITMENRVTMPMPPTQAVEMRQN